MKQLPILMALLVVTELRAGYLGCESKPEYYDYKRDRLMQFTTCDYSGIINRKWPEDIPTSVEVLSFDHLNIGREVQTSSLVLMPDSQAHGYRNENFDLPWNPSDIQSFRTDLKDYVDFWTKRGFEKIKFQRLLYDQKNSTNVRGKTYVFRDLFEWPDSKLKIGWSMSISRGKVQDDFKVFVLDSKGKETELKNFLRPPVWTYTGGASVSFYTDPQRQILFIKFGDTWSGTYFFKTGDYGELFGSTARK